MNVSTKFPRDGRTENRVVKDSLRKYSHRPSVALFVSSLTLMSSYNATADDSRNDVHSYSNPAEVVVRHVSLDLHVDFKERELVGTVTLQIERAPGASTKTPLILDARELRIEKAEAGPSVEKLHPTVIDLTTPQPILGSKLTIWIQPKDSVVRITYKTSPNAKALQWLEPKLTKGKVKPFLFTQSQAIQARSWIPIQDSPGVRVTYDATIWVGDGLKVLMSAKAVPTTERMRFHFRMDHLIPPYLIALAVGDLGFRELGPRTGVWAEPGTLDRAASEFVDVEKMVKSVESRFGKYRWGRYDIVVLPPSFPFGGMENPCLTFATPTILAGDRSLVSLIAHELAHSWSGNLVTNATWRDFWLNEGFTTYLEQRIIEDLYGRERADIERVLGLRDLQEELATLPAAEQILHIDLAGRDPDDGVTRVPYEKGALFLSTLEAAFGRERFDEFLLGYFDRHAFKSITTADFLDDLKANLFAKDPKAARGIDLVEWIEKPGLPKHFAMPKSPALDAVDKQAADWTAGRLSTVQIQSAKWSTQEWVRFLQSLPTSLDAKRLAELDRGLKLSDQHNVEIVGQWLLMSIRGDYAASYPKLETFLIEIGRRKFIVPLYKELMKTAAGRELAKAIYAKARPGYHPIAVGTLDEIVNPPAK